MSVTLVSSNDDPRPVDYHIEWGTEYFHPAEHLQADELAEANGIAAFVAGHFCTFAAGAVFGLVAHWVSEIVILLIVKGVSWS